MKRIVLSVCAGFAAAVVAQDETLYWKGTSASAKVATNWCTDEGLTATASAAPQNGDSVVFVAASGNMTWDLDDVALASWTQREGYAGTVTFSTGKKNGVAATLNGWTDDDGETRILKLSGDCVLLGGTWTHTGQPKTMGASTAAVKDGLGVYRIILEAGGNVQIGANATIDCNNKGFGKNGGPDGGTGCASHGGCGSVWTSNYRTMKCYGSIRQPVTLGSGGSFDGGGGAVRISCKGSLTVDGTISVTGNNTTDWHTGAGGSIWLTAKSLAGGGMINANGGHCPKTGYDEGGGGGRISVLLTGDGEDFSGFTGTMKAKLGKPSGNNGYDGAGGTIYRETAADRAGCGELIIDNTELAAGETPHDASDLSLTAQLKADCDVTPRRIVLRPGAKLSIETNLVFTLPPIVQETDPNWTIPGFLSVNSGELVVTDLTAFATFPVPVILRGAGSKIRLGATGGETLTAGPSFKLVVNNSATIDGSLHLLSGAKLTHTSNVSTRMNLAITGDLTVDAGGSIDTTACGASSFGCDKTSNNSNGGTYGGRGTNNSIPCYGSVRFPTDYGSAGYGNQSSNGGGAIRLSVAGDLVLNGAVRSNGGDALYRTGSGGSVWISARTLTGAGAISANGGTQTSGGYASGGGGRVAVYLTDSSATFDGFTGPITAYGGVRTSAKAVYAGAGTVYLKRGDQADDAGTLIIANSNCTSYATELMTGGAKQNKDVTDLDVGEVIVRGAKAVLDNATVTVRRGWTTEEGAILENHADGNLLVAGAEDATFRGANTFYDFACAVPGKKLYFGTDAEKDLLTIAENGSLTWRGDPGEPLQLLPTVADDSWRVSAPASVKTELEHLTVSRSIATGAKLAALNSTESPDGSCVNWSFSSVVVGETNTWKGVSSVWSDVANWDRERPPAATDVLLIPATAHDPVLAGGVEAYGLKVESGAALMLNGYPLTVTDNLTVQGRIVFSDTERLACSGSSVTLAAGALEPARGTFALTGVDAQTVALSARFWNLSVEKNSGDVAWSGTCSVGRTLSLTATGALTMTFAGGTVLAADDFLAEGTVAGAPGLTLTGMSWKLKAAKRAVARGVRVAGCDASEGNSVYVSAPFENLGDNANWKFGTGVAIWTGAKDGDFTNDLNWAGGTAPDAETVAEIAAGATVTISSPVTVGGLFLGGGTGAVQLKANAELTVNGLLSVGTNATLELNAPATARAVEVLAGGEITHAKYASGVQRTLDLSVTGDMVVDANGKVSAAGKGPGDVNIGSTGASHGGRGYNGVACYGSYVHPSKAGSHGRDSQSGGIVRLKVGGALVVNGQVDADAKSTAYYYGSSGGSVWITCGSLSGAGMMSAAGANGSFETDGGYTAGGGRISVEVTQADGLAGWSGMATAYGGHHARSVNFTGMPNASAGTVAWSEPGAHPTVVIENKNTTVYVSGADLPAQDGDASRILRDLVFVVKDAGVLNVTADVTIYDLDLQTANAALRLNGHTLTIRSQAHKDRAGWKGSVSLGTNGQIVWKKPGFALIIK